MTLKPADILAVLLATAVPASADTVVTVNGRGIPASRAEPLVKAAVAQGQKDTPELRATIRRHLIVEEVLVQEAERTGLLQNQDVLRQIEQARRSILIAELVRAYVSKNPVSEADIKAHYDTWKAQQGDTEYHVAHIVVDSEEAARTIISKLKSGARFQDLARQSKDTGSAANGGDLGWVSPSALPKTFGAALGSLKKGQFTERPIQTEAGFHVIKVDDARPLTLPTLDEAREQISKTLVEEKARAYQDALVKKATIN